MTIRVLVVDDEPRFVRLVEANLLTEGFEVLTGTNGNEAVQKAADEKPDLVLLDVMMPEMDGFEACERIREFSNVPLIMLTAKGNEEHRVQGLNLGADDYIVKPFSANELLARVHAVLRRARASAAESNESVLKHGELEIDLARAEVRYRGEQISLSSTEYRLLLEFARNAGETLTAEKLLEGVWGEEYKDEKEILWVSISRLRQKLETDPKRPKLIQTRSGAGYIMP
ncbi:MAG: DNA-binding response regulator [Chloroflexi bacterium]|nr:response regulator transcription factor [Chloroflexota bacterium]MQC26190.1 DNA-binding response regulator [Chloroflexota bacterium]